MNWSSKMDGLPPIVQQLIYIGIIVMAMLFGNALFKKRHGGKKK